MITKKAPSLEERRPECGGVGAGSAGRHGLAGAVGESPEGLGVADGDVGQDLAVELHAGLLEAVHEGPVAHAVLAGGRVDTGDPQPAEVALAVAAVPVAVLVGLEDGFLGPLVVRVGLAAVPLGHLEGGPALLPRADGALDAGHAPRPSRFLTRLASCGLITAGWACRRRRLDGFFSRMWIVKAERPRTLPVAVTLKRFLVPEWVFIFGMGPISKAKAPGRGGEQAGRPG